ncbi:acyl-phosphate glycerol 3-phosphate acyltransferase [Aphanothece hegewaldii CCALA 016]|uniref:Glycerol-3-phosphate acyltransferase n=1 Tax=Aphanothece hegewaldii CCALA 016 TaxID=2107694 RepID=A0A2T1LUJ3_9CHRO|nr:glycerol-3-phosphate 1-O-acyltransferase PlsY [Aphanothece hegewaldii]PSF35164.1 acyl-phosphate glycerol 3-phosphate acyltransferase [Aphanothece hegewaldii CCALA 016]
MINPFLASGLLILFAYLLGSIPTGYLLGKYLKGIDIREHGSGSTGATNVLRNLGKPAGITVLVIDLLKGVGAIALAKSIYTTDINPFPETWKFWLITLAGIASLIGHSKSVFLNFSGGKSVATSLGVLLMMCPWVGLGTLGSFLAVLGISRIVSFSSITGAIAVPFLMILLQQPLPYILFAAFAGIYVIVRHRSNIERLIAGTEPRIGQKLQEG